MSPSQKRQNLCSEHLNANLNFDWRFVQKLISCEIRRGCEWQCVQVKQRVLGNLVFYVSVFGDPHAPSHYATRQVFTTVPSSLLPILTCYYIFPSRQQSDSTLLASSVVPMDFEFCCCEVWLYRWRPEVPNHQKIKATLSHRNKNTSNLRHSALISWCPNLSKKKSCKCWKQFPKLQNFCIFQTPCISCHKIRGWQHR